MKSLLLVLAVVLVGCGKKEAESPTVEIANPIVERAIRYELSRLPLSKKHEGELTKADLEKVTSLNFGAASPNLPPNRILVQAVPTQGNAPPTHLGRNLTDMKELEKLPNLVELGLWQNELTSVKGLEKLTQLTKLNLALNQLTDVKGLEKLTQLEYLYLEDNPDLTKAQIDALKKALPKCRIISNPKK